MTQRPGSQPPGLQPKRRQRSRYISSEVRERRLAAAGHRCEYRSPQGRRCNQRTALAIDHVVPFGRGGSHDEQNLRCLCRAHNQWTAEQEYGVEFMRAKVEAR